MDDEERIESRRQTEALERIADELEYQNAVLAELARAQHLTAVSANEYSEPDERARSSPNTRSLLTMIRDQEHERDRDDDDRLMPDGGYPADADEHPEGVDDEFLARLNSIEAAEERVDELREEVGRLNDLPLDEEDTERLLWARLSGWSLTDIRGAFEAVDELQNAASRDLTIRLLAQLGQMTQEETEELLDEMDTLRRKYEDNV